MVARLIEGWESSTALADYAGKWTAYAGAPTIGTASGRFGNGLRLTTSANQIGRTLDAQATWVVGFALRPSAAPSAVVSLCHFVDNGIIHCGIGLTDSAAALFAWRATTSTVLGTSGTALTPGVWAYVEVKVTINDTTGSVVVRVNGATVLNLTGQDTRNAGNASANVVRLGGTSSLPGALTLDYDDVYLLDATGSVNTDFLGDCKVAQLLPTGAGATTAWTPSAGANYACVDEAPPNGDADYVASSTAAQTDTYAYADLAVTGTVKAVQATVQARKDDAGARSLAVVARPGGTDRVGTTQAVGDTYALCPQLWDTNPDTAAAWTVAEVNSSQFGQRLIA